jgi:hypothetical protein
MNITVLGEQVDAAKFLVALYNNTQAFGIGKREDRPEGIPLEEAQRIVEQRGHFNFEYVYGRPLKTMEVDGVISADSEALYDRDAGYGRFAAALIEALAS